jgi:hypothetical protein
MPGSCPHCSVALVRSRRRGVAERVFLAPFPYIRPFRCPRCPYRRLRFTRRPNQTAVLLLLLTIMVGILLVQTIVYVGDRARDYTDTKYQPKDLDRSRYMEEKKQVKP